MIRLWVVLTLVAIAIVQAEFLLADDTDDSPPGGAVGRGDLGISDIEYEYEDEDSPFFTLDWGYDDDDQPLTDETEEDVAEEDGGDADDTETEAEETERDDNESEDKNSFKKQWQTYMRRMRESNNRWRRVLQRALHGQWDVNPYFKVDWDLRFLADKEKWWNGPNICKRTEEEEEELEANDSSIIRHHMISSSVCDDTGTVYKCTTIVEMPSKKKKLSVIYECCHGFQREPGQPGCTKELVMRSLLETVEDLGAHEMLDAISGIPLTEFLENGNYTIFAPKDGIIGQYKPTQNNEPNVVIITPGLVEMAKELEETVMSHIAPGHIKTTYLEDEQLIPTLSQGNNIRINIYERPKTLVTANCHPIVSSDNLATNGVVHLVDGILTPVKESIASIVSKNPDLSMFKTVLGQSGLLSMLKNDGQFTLMAPSNSAFHRLDPDVQRKLLSGEQCVKEVIRNHLLPNVICSSILEGRLLALNALNNFLNVTRTDDGKLFVDGAQILDTDIMATNGVIHIIDEVLIPEEALTLLEIAKQMEDKTYLNLVQRAGLTKKFTQLHNYTLFLPTPEAIQNIPEKTMQSLMNDTEKLADVLLYHVLPSLECDTDLEDRTTYNTLLSGKQVTIRNFQNFPFGLHSKKTVQCAAIEAPNAGACGGVIHFIDRMMMPPSGNVFDLLQEKSEFSQLVKLMKKTGIADILQEDGHFTVFAPTNRAFSSLGEETMKFLEENPEKLKGLLKHHITKEVVCCSGVFGDILSETRPTLDGRVILTNRKGGQVVVNQVPIKHCDNMATNGIVHTIDKVLPEALNRYVTRHMRHNGRLQWHMHFGGDNFGRGLEDYVQTMLEHMFGLRRSRIRREQREDDGVVDSDQIKSAGRDAPLMDRIRNSYWDWPNMRRRHRMPRQPERMWDYWRRSEQGKRRRHIRSAEQDDDAALVDSDSGLHGHGHYAHGWPRGAPYWGYPPRRPLPYPGRDYWPGYWRDYGHNCDY